MATPESSQWSAVQALPLVPAAAAHLPDGRVLLWAAEEKFSFGGTAGRTESVIFDPATGSVTERTITETGHNMFCPGTTLLADGRLLVNGGISSAQTSLFDASTGVWSTGPQMNVPRGYQANTLLRDGSVLTLGGSWSGGIGNKHGEVWSVANAWQRKIGIPIDSMLSVDNTRHFGMDSHFMLLPAGNGLVFHAGPGVNMHWINTDGDGLVTPAGPRGDDEFSVNGNAVMFEAGKILKTGGSPGYDSVNANANSYLIDINNGVSVRKLAPMAYRRAFHNSVVLPNGQVLIVGGQTFALGFSDNNSVLAPELFDPTTESFGTLPPMAVPRNYHSVALLLPDGRVLAGGGGLCGAGCAVNHADLQLLTPHYLLKPDGTPAVRPVIQAAPASVRYGQAMDIVTDTAVSSFALVRMSSATHGVNNDQRRLSLSFRSTGSNTYSVDIPTNPGWALPGNWMLFAMNADGTPSVARTLRISNEGAAQWRAMDDQASSTDSIVSVEPRVTLPPGGVASFSARGLPAGLSIDPATGRISGQPTTPGLTQVAISVSVGGVTTSTDFRWSVQRPGQTRFVRLEALSEANNQVWASAAEIQLLGFNGLPLASKHWRVSASSEELTAENGAAANAVDGDRSTHWHTRYRPSDVAMPHSLTIDLGTAQHVAGLRYLPRQDGGVNGSIARYNIYTSRDGVNWGVPVISGNFSELGSVNAPKTIHFNNVAQGKPSTQSSQAYGGIPGRAVDGNTDGNDAHLSVSHTAIEANAWWEVDLGSSHTIDAIRIWNRSDCCAERLNNFHLLISDTPMQGRAWSELLADPSVWRSHQAGTAPRSSLIDTPSAKGRFVRLQLAGTQALSLAEVQVHGRPALNRSPSLATPAPPPAEQGISTRLIIDASDPDDDSLRFSAAGLPPGLSIAPDTGVISGVPGLAGIFSVTVAVDDGRGGSTATQFVWTVTAAVAQIEPVVAPPVGRGQPAHYVVETGLSGTYSYRWDFGDGSTPSAWSPQNTTQRSFASPGVYRVTVSVRNADGRISTRSFWQAVQGATGLGGSASSPLLVESRPGASHRVWSVNPDNNSVSVFDSASRTRVAEIAVGAQPRNLARAPDGRIWVSNRNSDSLSIVSPISLTVVQTIGLARASQPYGLVIAADGTAYVSLQATGTLVRLNPDNTVTTSTRLGPGVRHLALDAAGKQLLAPRFISPPQPGEDTAVLRSSTAGRTKGGELMLLDAGSLAWQRSIVLQHSERADNAIQARGVPNYLGAPAITPDGRSAWVPSKQDNIGRGRLRDGRELDFQSTLRAVSSRVDLSASADDLDARIDHDNAGLASAALFHPSGAYLFVALETSRQVAVIDPIGKRELFRVDAGRAPQGLAVSPDGLTLYVQNFMDRTVGVHDLTRLIRFGETALPQLAAMPALSSERLNPQVLRGKQFFYDARDPRLARDGYISCASCHNEGGHDGRTWDFTGFGEGLRNTASLIGRAGSQGRLHWSANFDEVQDVEGQIRSLAQGTGLMADAQFHSGTRNQPLGDRKSGLSADLDALAAYVASLDRFDANPWRNADGSLSAEAAAGQAIFVAHCASCHGGNDFSDSAGGVLRSIGTLKTGSGSRLGQALTGIDTPTLRDAWATAPYLHDGSAATLADAVRAHTAITLTATEVAQVSAYVGQIGREESAISPRGASGTGLRGEYYANAQLSGSPVLTRTEAVDFEWSRSASDAHLPADHFSVRWTGGLRAPRSGRYRFKTVSDDGVRLWVDGRLVINNWGVRASATNTSPAISLAAGQSYAIRLEYFDSTGPAVMRLQWRQLGDLSSFKAIPASLLFTP